MCRGLRALANPSVRARGARCARGESVHGAALGVQHPRLQRNAVGDRRIPVWKKALVSLTFHS